MPTYKKYGFSWAVKTPSAIKKKHNKEKNLKGLLLNFGPQHPASHGILKLSLQLVGENIRAINADFGYLHRGTEKLEEERTAQQSLPYYDRFDYVANLFQEYSFCLAVEALAKPINLVSMPIRVARDVFKELSRILNHLLTVGASSLDVGAMGPMFWAFEERELIFELFEEVSGGRMHTNMFLPFVFDLDSLTDRFFFEISLFLTRCSRSLAGAFLALLNNRIFKSRLSFVGQIRPLKARRYGITGVLGRSTGRFIGSLENKYLDSGSTLYTSVRFFLGKRGDNLDRLLIRIKEMVESFRVLTQLISLLRPKVTSWSKATLPPLSSTTKLVKNIKLELSGFSKSPNKHSLVFLQIKKLQAMGGLFQKFRVFFMGSSNLLKVHARNNLSSSLKTSLTPGRGKFATMEAVIEHFGYVSEGFILNPGFTYQRVDSPKGEVGVFLVGSGSAQPARVKLRSPVAHNLDLIPFVCKGLFVADFISTFCSLDVVLGEIDK